MTDLHSHRSRGNAARTPAASACQPQRRDGDGMDDLRQQRERPHLPRQVVRQEVASMAARFQSLRDDAVRSVRLQPPGSSTVVADESTVGT